MSDEIPVYQEQIGGALIDAARISVMGAIALLPPPEVPRIIMPGTDQQMAEDAACSVHGCLDEAMRWLDAARAMAALHLETKGSPPTSLHVVGGVRT
jgi:hypothetical protein